VKPLEGVKREEEFFSKKNDQLLNIATWARYLAWVVLVHFIFLAVFGFIGSLNMVSQFSNLGTPGFLDLANISPFTALKFYLEAIGLLVKGAIYFLVLGGISLGLNMIIETDINYREKANQRGER
jgi:hypothetical protein